MTEIVQPNKLYYESLGIGEQIEMAVDLKIKKIKKFIGNGSEAIFATPDVEKLRLDFIFFKWIFNKDNATSDDAKRYKILKQRFDTLVGNKIGPLEKNEKKTSINDAFTVSNAAAATKKLKKTKRKLNKRARAVKIAYEKVKKGETEFSDNGFISLANPGFNALVKKITKTLK